MRLARFKTRVYAGRHAIALAQFFHPIKYLDHQTDWHPLHADPLFLRHLFGALPPSATECLKQSRRIGKPVGLRLHEVDARRQ